MIGAGPLSLPSPNPMRLRADDTDQALAPRATRSARASQASGAAVTLFAALVLLVVTIGWLFRDRIPLTPRHGLGSGLGVGGAVTMLMLTTYSAAKRVRFLRAWSPLSHWFRIHMILGVLGPVLILFHCKFHFGAPNSNVALVSMLVVAASGVVGRYIYGRISHGLYGARATLDELHAQLDVSAQTLGERLPPASRAAQRLAAFAMQARVPRRTIGGRLSRLATLPLRAIWVHRCVLHDFRADLENAATQHGWDARTRRASEEATRKLVRAYIAAIVKETQFSAYERLFSLWHALHIPLFVMLLLAGVIHVVAVHLY
jgi:hypothetical protein